MKNTQPSFAAITEICQNDFFKLVMASDFKYSPLMAYQTYIKEKIPLESVKNTEFGMECPKVLRSCLNYHSMYAIKDSEMNRWVINKECFLDFPLRFFTVYALISHSLVIL